MTFVYRAAALFGAGVASLALGGAAVAADATYVVSSSNQTINTQFGAIPVYDGGLIGENSGGGSVAVTATMPDAQGGAGSLEIHGDRSREIEGNIYGNGSNNIFALSTLQSVTFDKMTTATTASQLHAQPVVRVHGFDSSIGSRFELVDEGVYNGGTSGVVPTLGQWVNADSTQNWYINIRTNGAAFLAANAGKGLTLSDGTSGVVYLNGSQLNAQLTNLFPYFSSDTGVSGFSQGAGSGFGAGFTGFIDNFRVATSAGSFTLNFDPAGAVPEPASWAMMVGGFGLLGAGLRRARRSGAAIA